MDSPYPRWIFIFLLLLLNALFSAGRAALKEVNKAALTRAEEGGNKTAGKVLAVAEDPKHFSAALRVGGVLCKIIAFALTYSLCFAPLNDGLQALPFSGFFAGVIITLAFTAIFAWLGDLYPARAAEQMAESYLLHFWTPLRIFGGIVFPFAATVNGLASLLLKITGLRIDPDDALSKEEIQTLVEESGDSGLINENERDMLEGIFDFTEKTAEDVMTPRTETYMIDADAPLSEYLSEMLNEKYSRVPVYRGEVDNIIGVLYLKDFMCEAYRVGFENVDINRCLHNAYFVPEHKRIDALYRELQKSKNHMAILIDEYGGFSGVVTIEDLIEEVMGDIDDEYDESKEEIHPENDGTYLLDGATPIREINEALNLQLDEEDEDYDTIGGLIIKLLGYIPTEDEPVESELRCGNCLFSVEKIGDKRIDTVRMKILPAEDEPAEKSEA